jgi:metallophosphoesterase (TIGR00282 family)
MSDTIKIIFFGDIVGKPGRFALRDFLSENRAKYDFVVANVENASHGFGLTEKNYNDFIEYGVNAMTSGNHIWDKKEIFNYIENASCLIRPLNYPKDTPGVGYRIIDCDKFKVGVINVLGRVFMNIIDSPWDMIKDVINEIKKETPIVILDFHAEATAEKICFGKYCSDLGLSAFFGTHTHVQTADESIIAGMAYISDVGFCGASDGVIGMDYNTSLSRFLTALPERYEVAEGEVSQINALEVDIDINTGKALNVKRVLCSNSKVEGSGDED